MPDYYAILEVSPSASPAEIKRSYRRLVRKYHPDLHKDALDLHIKRLNEAYNVVGDRTKRAAYDAQRQEEARRAAYEAAAKEALRRQSVPVKREPEMTWIQGIFGFVKEMKKGMREGS